MTMFVNGTYKEVKKMAKSFNVANHYKSKSEIISDVSNKVNKDPPQFNEIFEKMWKKSGGYNVVYLLKFVIRLRVIGTT